MSSLGLLDGIKTGYSMMSNTLQQQENKRRYDQQFAQNEQRYNDEQTRQAGLDEMNKKQRESQQINADLNQQINQYKLNNLQTNQDLNVQAKKTQIKANQSRIDYNNSRNSAFNEGIKQKKAAEYVSFKLSMGEMTYQDLNNDKLDGTLFANFRNRGAAEAWIKLGDLVGKGDFKAAVPLFNEAYKPQLNVGVGTKGKDGGKILDVKVTGMTPVANSDSVQVPLRKKDNVIVQLEIITDKGSYPSTLTEFRSAKPNDKNKNIPIGDLINQIGAMATTAKTLKGKINTGLRSYLGKAQKQEEAPTQTANVRNLAQAMNISEGEAWKMMLSAKQNPQLNQQNKSKYVAGVVQNFKSIADKTPEQVNLVMQQAQAEADKIFGGGVNSNQQNNANSQQDAMLKALYDQYNQQLSTNQ